MGKIPVLIDTDVDIDDWMAILYLLKHPGVHVLGITTTGCGASHLTPGTRNAHDLTMLTEFPDTPVAAGTSTPHIYSNQFPSALRRDIDTLYGLSLPRNPRPLDDRPAVRFLHDTLRAAELPVTILAIGGGTNLGALLLEHPEVKPKIARIVMMGGTINLPGNIVAVANNYTNKVAEWSIFLDVIGAQLMLGSGVPITLVPLDACQYVRIDKQFYDRLDASCASRAARFVRDALKADLESVESGDFYAWDPLAAAILVDPELARPRGSKVSPQQMQLEVVQTLDEEDDRSGELRMTTKGPVLDVAMWASADGFYDRFLKVINLPDRAERQ
ncbi:MAG TPA: nucleoside hydrolase [Kofleriaceae bacterium]|nr:nucleoside hydrolase [Kofleriaceae bacterium]